MAAPSHAPAATADGPPRCFTTGRPLPMTLHATLTESEAKAFYYAQEAYFREGWRDAIERLGPGAAERLQTFSFVAFKPDAIMARSLERCLALLADDGFATVAATSFRFDRLSMRELWRYELNLATLERFDAIDILLTTSDSILVVVEDLRGGAQSAAARLSALKGSSLRERRRPEHLRTRLGAGTGMLNHIHTPDEPADLLRELGLLLPRARRRELFEAIAQGHRDVAPVLRLAAQVAEQVPAHDLDVGRCLDRVTALCAETLTGPVRIRALHVCEQLRAGGAAEWCAVLDGLDAAGAPLSPGDRAVFAAGVARADIPGIHSFLHYPLVPELAVQRVAE